MSVRTVYFNGAFVPESEARVSIFDSALMYGDMAFEMTRTFNHKPFRLREHLERLYGSLRLLEIDCGLTIDEMERATLATLERNIPTESADACCMVSGCHAGDLGSAASQLVNVVRLHSSLGYRPPAPEAVLTTAQHKQSTT